MIFDIIAVENAVNIASHAALTQENSSSLLRYGKYSMLADEQLFFCRPDYLDKNREMISAYIGVLIMLGTAIYARLVT